MTICTKVLCNYPDNLNEESTTFQNYVIADGQLTVAATHIILHL